MAIRFTVPESATEQVAFAYSPAMEAVLSLHILVEPKHHPLHHEWVRAARHRLSPSMKKVISGFRFAHSNYIPPVLLPSALGPLPSRPSFDEELDRLRQRGPDLGLDILRYFAAATPVDWHTLDDPAVQATILRETARLGPSTFGLTQLGIDDPAALAKQFLEFLHRYWHECGFREQWEQTEPLLARTVTDIGRKMANDGLFGMLSGLAPEITVDPGAGTFWVRRAADEDLVIDGRSRLVIALSGFIWPHVGVINNPPHHLGLVYPVTAATPDLTPNIPPAGLVPLLRALADDTRLHALRLIARRPRSTQELAQLLHVSEAAVSKHLRQLTLAGLLQSHRDGYYVLYGLVPDHLHQLSGSLVAYLGAEAADDDGAFTGPSPEGP